MKNGDLVKIKKDPGSIAGEQELSEWVNEMDFIKDKYIIINRIEDEETFNSTFNTETFWFNKSYIETNLGNANDFLQSVIEKYPEKTNVKCIKENDNIILEEKPKFKIDNGIILGIISKLNNVDNDNDPDVWLWEAETNRYAEIINNSEPKQKHPLEGRYLKVINDSCINHYSCKKGDYLLFQREKSGLEYWGNPFRNNEPHYYGKDAHKMSYFELMPDGFHPNETISKSLSKEEILEKAKRDYPIGSKFIDLVNNATFTVKNQRFDNFGDESQLYVLVEQHKDHPNKGAKIYKNGKWAEIISKPDVKTDSNNYLSEVKGVAIAPPRYGKSMFSNDLTLKKSPGIENETFNIILDKDFHKNDVWEQIKTKRAYYPLTHSECFKSKSTLPIKNKPIPIFIKKNK